MKPEHFNSSIEDCEKHLQQAVAASEVATGRLRGWPAIWGSMLHARVILNTSSMIKIIEAADACKPGEQLLDHFSVASIARTAMEAGIMMLYVSDPEVDAEIFEMRRKVFILHDTCHRSRVFKHGQDDHAEVREMRDMYRAKIRELKDDLEESPAFLSLSTETKQRILDGRDYFVGGIRGALRQIRWDLAEYEFLESYLSGYLHSMPMSFLRADQHDINFHTISDFQYNLCSISLTVATDTLKRTTTRMTELLDAISLGDSSA